MFGWNKKKGFDPGLEPGEISFITDNILQIIKMLGLERVRKSPFITLDHPLLQCGDLRQSANFRNYWTLMCAALEIDPHRVGLKVLDKTTHHNRGAWTMDSSSELVGSDKVKGTKGDPVMYVEVLRARLDQVGMLSFDLAYKLLEAKADIENWRMDEDENVNRCFVELMAIYLGFGILMINFSIEKVSTEEHLKMNTNLIQSAIVYAAALVCHLSGMDTKRFAPLLKPTMQAEFTDCYDYISRHEPDGFSPNAIQNADLAYRLHKAVSDGFAQRDYQQVLTAAQQKLAINPRDQYAYNNRGYALLQQRDYAGAIAAFTKGIQIDPDFSFLYNNRGYCYLMIGDEEKADDDFYSGEDLEPDNSYQHRNKGVVQLLKQQYSAALGHFQKALKRDPKTDLIHFYIGLAYYHLSNHALAKASFAASAAARENNDSIFAMPELAAIEETTTPDHAPPVTVPTESAAHTPEFWETHFAEKKEMWGLAPAKSALYAEVIFRDHGVRSVLIPGIGYGRNAQPLLAAGMQVTGIEISETAIELAQKLIGDRVRIHCGSVGDMPFDEVVYDGIFCYQLIHLLDEDERHNLLSNCWSQLTGDGLMVFTVISKAAPNYGKGTCVGPDRYEAFPGAQVYFYDRESIQEEFGTYGLVEVLEIDEHHPSYLIICRKRFA